MRYLIYIKINQISILIAAEYIENMSSKTLLMKQYVKIR